jgi:hypothetical protein
MREPHSVLIVSTLYPFPLALVTYSVLVTSVSDSTTLYFMRTSASQSQLRFPLTRLLGNGGSVRVLRALIAYGGPLSVSQLAHECCLSRQGTYQTLNSLVSQRLVRVLGQARSQLFTIDTNHPLSPGLKELFGHEQSRWDELLQVLRDTFQTNKDIHAAWYYGSVARGEDEPHSDLDIAVTSIHQAHTALDALVGTCAVDWHLLICCRV